MRSFVASARNSTVLHGGVERLAQDRHVGVGRAHRDEVRPLERLLAHDQLHDPAAVVVLHVLVEPRHGHLGQLVVRVRTDLQQEIQLAVANPFRLLRLGARPFPAAGAIDLAALHRQRDVERALVAGNDAHRRAGRGPHHVGEVVHGVAGRHAAQHDLLGHRLLERPHLRLVVGDADAGAAVGGAEIGDLGRVEHRLRLVVEQRADDGAGRHRADRQPVLGRDLADMDAGLGAARARHVLHHHVWIAGNVAAEMPRHRARIDVEATAGIVADHEVDGLAGVVVLGGRRSRGGDHAGRRDQTCLQQFTHQFSPMA